MLSKNEAIEIINKMAAAGEPFLFITDFDNEENYVLRPTELAAYGISFSINNFASGNDCVVCCPAQAYFEAQPMSFGQYSKGFEVVMRHLEYGNTYLTNLTYPSKLSTNHTLESIYANARAAFRLLWRNRFVVFSPELFVRISAGGLISSYPMKGTIDADLPDAQQQLLNNPKELAEHITIVDLIRNDLSRVAKQVRVKRFRYTDRLQTNRKNLLQVSSEIVGQLPDNWQQQLGNTLYSLLPAGSVTGAPKTKTIEIIKQAEGYARGFYTGVFGYFDGQSFVSAVMIRFVEQNKEGLQFKSGGGITIFSNALSEYEELKNKVYLSTGG